MIRELRQKHKINILLEVSGLARSTYYYHVSTESQPDKYAFVKQEIQRIFAENKGRVGYRRVTLELNNHGHRINHKTVYRLMKQLGLFCAVRRRKYRSYRGEVGKTAPNILERQFTAEEVNQKWVTDITEFSLFGTKLYLSPIMDLFNQEIISYSLSCHPYFSQVTDMLKQAFEKIGDDTNLILHSDQGWQYQMKQYQRMLKDKGVRQSMSRRGNCLDNAMIENFFGHLKSELLYLQTFESMEHFKKELVEYIAYYNKRRIKAKLKGMSPVDYRLHTLNSS